MKDGQPAPIMLENYAPPPFLVEDLRLRFVIHETFVLVRSILKVSRNDRSPDDTGPLVLDGAELELLSVRRDGKVLEESDYTLTQTSLSIAVSKQAVIEIENKIYPNQNTSLEGLYVSGGVYCTQCEAEGFRKITFFPDRPDVMTRYTTTIVAHPDHCPTMLSNGNLVRRETFDDGLVEVTWEDPFPKPSYLFALVAGDLEVVEEDYETVSGKSVKLQIFVEPHNVDKCDHAMVSLKKAMRWDEVVYGREYDLDLYMIVAVDDFNMGAMENKGLNVFNSKFVLAKRELATDRDYANIENVVAHEYFHNWTGNRITCRDWFQLTLKEGLTVFRDQQFSADMTSRPLKRIEDVDILRSRQFPEDAGPMAHPIQPQSYVEINNFYTVTVYNKGAEVIRMMHCLTGTKGFRRGMDLYFASHDGEAVTVFDFLRAIEEGSGTYLKKFKNWYQQAGTPTVHVSAEFEPDVNCYSLTFRQTCPETPGQKEKLPFPIPIKMGLLDKSGDEILLRFEGEDEHKGCNVTILLDTEERTVHFSGINEKPVASVLREFSAPVRLDFPREDAELAFLMANDTDEFNRWDAGQTLAMRMITRAVEQQDLELLHDQAFSDAFLAVLQDQELDGALAARALMLPSEEYVSQQIKPIPVNQIREALDHLRRHLADSHRDVLLEVYQAKKAEIRGADSSFMGQRSLKNTCLDFLSSLGESALLELCYQQFSDADNMTDQGAALRLLSFSDSVIGRQALLEFHDKWQQEPLAMDKWFTFQALATHSDTLKNVKRLKQHELFDLGNPNRVRSLVAAFAEYNPPIFHAIDGSGYEFLADTVLELNDRNPQLGARLVVPLTLWEPHRKERQQRMCEQLERIADHPNLVKNVYELVDKSLSTKRSF
ncbi:MAG: aminopeptidase N [Pseudomonadota bacterium]